VPRIKKGWETLLYFLSILNCNHTHTHIHTHTHTHTVREEWERGERETYTHLRFLPLYYKHLHFLLCHTLAHFLILTHIPFSRKCRKNLCWPVSHFLSAISEKALLYTILLSKISFLSKAVFLKSDWKDNSENFLFLAHFYDYAFSFQSLTVFLE